MKSKSASKVKLASYDDLFGLDSPDSSGEAVTSVPLKLLRPFKNHPFQVNDDDQMQEMVDSIKKYGVLMPGIVRPHLDGGYEVVAGHRRWHACERAGLTKMPVIIRNLDDDTAVVFMVDTNIQRENLLPSEKAYAYKMKYEAIRHQGAKGERNTADIVGEAAGESGRTVQRYIRLTELQQDILEYVDKGKITISAGEKLSYLKVDEQSWLTIVMKENLVYPSKGQAEQLKTASQEGNLTKSKVQQILKKTGSKANNVTLSTKKIRDYFPADYTKIQIEKVIYELLDQWKRTESGEK